jgi:hypothetical protein
LGRIGGEKKGVIARERWEKEKGKGNHGRRRGERKKRKKEVKERKEKKGRERDNLTLKLVQIFCDRTRVVICVSIRISI